MSQKFFRAYAIVEIENQQPQIEQQQLHTETGCDCREKLNCFADQNADFQNKSTCPCVAANRLCNEFCSCQPFMEEHKNCKNIFKF